MEQLGPLTRHSWTQKFLHETLKVWYNSTINNKKGNKKWQNSSDQD